MSVRETDFLHRCLSDSLTAAPLLCPSVSPATRRTGCSGDKSTSDGRLPRLLQRPGDPPLHPAEHRRCGEHLEQPECPGRASVCRQRLEDPACLSASVWPALSGSDRRIHYMISKGGSEVLLTALVNTARTFSPNYTVLLPLLHLLAKVGHRDRRIGVKAEDAGAVLLTLNLLKQNLTHAQRAAACLLVLQVFCTSVSAANIIGENQGLEVIYRLIPHRTTRHRHAGKISINAFAALLSTKANVEAAVSGGYISGLLRLHQEWHLRDAEPADVEMCHALLRCLHQLAYSTAGQLALVSQGGLRLLYDTTQMCLSTKALETLVGPSVQLMRKCLPKTRLPLTSDRSAYTFPLPGRPTAPEPDECSEDSGDDDEDQEGEESKDYDDDLETDLNKLRRRPEPDRPKDQLPQYLRFCPELSHDFQGLDLSSGPDESSTASSSSDEEQVNGFSPPVSRKDRRRSSGLTRSTSESEPETSAGVPVDSHLPGPDFNNLLSSSPVLERLAGETRDSAVDEQNQEEAEESQRHSVIDRLLDRRGAGVSHHDPKTYRTVARKTKSIPGFDILAFPDFWGHVPPPGHEPMAPRRANVQRQKVFEDVQRFMNAGDIIDQVVFDLEDCSPQSPSVRADSLKFFSQFECGNLRKAVQVRRFEYDLVLNADANCSQHAQWFYFEVSNMQADVPYRFNVINCEKSNSQFNYGMQPVLYSVREALEGRPHWVRAGADVCYYRNHFCPARGRRKPSFYTLTFTITFKHQEDVCYLAYHYPYTYSALKAHLNVLQKSVDPAQVFFQQQVLCTTLTGNPCPVVTITACPASRGWRDMHQLRNRPCVFLTGRVHPGESNASWVMKGTLEFLCSSDPVAQSLREAFVFKIIPMLNPDGVINGTNRCDVNSEDLNRQWSRPDPVLCPTIYHAKGLLYYLNSIGRTPLVFCDYHGHSRKKNVFLYGCSVKETLWQSGSTVDTIGLKEDPGYRTIAKTLDRIAPAFSFNSCNYLVEKSRSATARVVVWREIGVLRSYTMENTYNGCDQGIYKGLQTGTRELQEMGMKFCHSLLSLTKDINILYKRPLITHVDLDSSLLDHKSHNCFEDDEPPCVEDIEYSADCPAPEGADLDSDVDKNMANTDRDSGDEGRGGGVEQRPSLRSRPSPLNGQRDKCVARRIGVDKS
ncbi:cytosolic carboxypeptidase 4 isoform X2 [Synchiropus splendidus]|uniref:cytosolic carboxypeptidase 4 isoform X2 n=1 Tax=Synchiropus splendidus TaxID=270530 RepID=UPI00237DC348|nr:cytosolic carboxypeptidase 4 isoform X2 [Synchiropus splendidus]